MKRLKQVLLGVLILFVTLIVFLAGSIAVDALTGSARLDNLANTIIPGSSSAPDVRAYVAQPDGEGPFPTVIMIHEFWGLNESITSLADLLAEDGYLVITPDTFRGSTTSWIPRAIFQVISTKPENVNADLDSVYTWLGSQANVDTNRIATVGFCYGGRTSLAYSLHNRQIAATVVFYGSPETDPQILNTLPGPVLGIFGEADQSIPTEQVHAFDAALTEARVPHEVTIYDGQPHAFVQNAEGVKSGGAQREAWNQMLAFLERNLKNKSAMENGLALVEYHAPFAWKYYALVVYEHALGTASHKH
ncbi:MAG TPA: dienelactone hydrolase family protein [Anaerolineales bacterium]|jgi:carboxymethylenebutenolidase|nr:dienelactone hydrolase family protein [Anaerolineales bacterium]